MINQEDLVLLFSILQANSVAVDFILDEWSVKMSLSDLLYHRRAVRHFDAERPIDSEKVKACLQFATLAPSSSNMQLYEFYHITDKTALAKLAYACLGQKAAVTAQEMVVFVVRQDLHRQRAKANIEFEIENVKNYSPLDRQAKRIQDKKAYYGKLIPFVYSRCFSLLGLLRKAICLIRHFSTPTVVDVSEADIRVVAHKSCGLAVQTFMLAMAEQGYDTCPMEGVDSLLIKKLLNLPRQAEINMVVSCGVRKAGRGVWGERFRVPFDDVYRKV